jgi:thioredoxin-related protein
MKRLSLLFPLLLCLVLGGTAQAAAPRDPATHFFDQSLGDFSEELETARAAGKKGIFLFFESADCPFCHRMKTTVLNQPEVQDAFKAQFLAFSVDTEGDVEITDFQGRTMSQKDFAFKINDVRATPVMAFYDLEGRQVVRYTGATRDRKEFLLLTDYVAQEKYKEMRFTRYKREHRAARKQ